MSEDNKTANVDTQQAASEDLTRASAVRSSRLSPIWIIPVVALLIGLWLVYDSFMQRGTEVVLTMSTAEGIEAGKTTIKTRNVDIGRVEQVSLSKDLGHVLIHARIKAEAADMLVEDTRFWVVKPRIGREGISGLGTVLSGVYIQLQPGSSVQARSQFEVAEQPPVTLDNDQGVRLKLISQLGNSLRVGDPVNYQGLIVGRVESAEFDKKSRHMYHQLFIEKPYDELVTENTRFWSTKGFDVNITAAGVNFNIGSLEALISGGVSFGVLEQTENDPVVKAEHEFLLYADEEDARQGSYDQYLEYVLLVSDTVRGLVDGAPVEYRGLRIGTVMEVPWRFTSEERNEKQGFPIPVLIRLEPQRLDVENELTLEQWKTRLQRMIDNGLRASLKAGNLLTGSLFVDLNFLPDAKPVKQMERFETIAVIPTTPTGLAHLEVKVSSLLDKLNALEIQPLLTGLEQNMHSSDAMLKEVQALVEDFRNVTNNPALQTMPENLNQTLTELQQTLKGFNADSPAYNDLSQSLQRLEKLLRDIQPAAKTLSEQPSALIFDRNNGPDPQPKASQSGVSP